MGILSGCMQNHVCTENDKSASTIQTNYIDKWSKRVYVMVPECP